MSEGFYKCRKEYEIRPISYEECKEWCLYKHYAHRMPNVKYSFGLFFNTELIGVCIFGIPASPSLIIGSMGEDWKENFIELNRLCVNDGLPSNVLSFFVSSTLKMLPKPTVVVSYADSGMGHHGYIYQATNFLYTGITKPHIEYESINGDNRHARHALDEYGGINKAKEKGIKLIMKQRTLKHRYFFFVGTKKQRRKMLASLKYPLCKYPKGDNSKYDASYKPNIQLTLF